MGNLVRTQRRRKAGVYGRRVLVLLLGGLVAGPMFVAFTAAAQDRALVEAELDAEFDARPLTTAEKRVLQLGLAVDGQYLGLIDGRWGQGSQAGLEALAARSDPRSRVDGIVRNYHVAALASRAIDFITSNELIYRGGAPWLHRMLTPPGEFVPDPDTPGIDDLVLEGRGIAINVMTSDLSFALELHTFFAKDLAPTREPYVVRNQSRLVTAIGSGSERFYARSDLEPDGRTWFTTLIGEFPSADSRLLDVIAASITLDPTAEIHAPNGRLVQLVGFGIELTRTPPPVAPIAPEPAAPPLEAVAPEIAHEEADVPAGGAGTAFYVNNTDLVTAKHVVANCARLSLADGTELTLVAEHHSLDLALLSSPQRSRDWIPVHLTGTARLGQRIIALGYPFYGAMSTALSSTGGNVSALLGLLDDPREITISAPIHPGNSGGPLLGPDGTVIGVVVSTLNKISVAELTGIIPENISYAVTGQELLGFLEAEGVSLPRQSADTIDFDEGIPESLQRAVLPVICHPD